MGTKPETELDTDGIDIEEVLKDILGPMMAQLTKELEFKMGQAIEQRFSEYQNSTDEPENEEDEEEASPKVLALQKRLQAMEEKAKAQEAADAQAKADKYLADLVAEHKPIDNGLAEVYLKSQLGQLVDNSGEYLTRDGKSVKEAVKAFFQTPTGQHLLPSQMKPGSGVPKGQAPRLVSRPELTTDEAIMATFGGF